MLQIVHFLFNFPVVYRPHPLFSMLMQLRMLKLSIGKGRQVIKQLCRRMLQNYGTVATERAGYVLYRALVLRCAESGVIMFYLMKGCQIWLICSPLSRLLLFLWVWMWMASRTLLSHRYGSLSLIFAPSQSTCYKVARKSLYVCMSVCLLFMQICGHAHESIIKLGCQTPKK